MIGGERAGYGKQIVATMSQQLVENTEGVPNIQILGEQ